MRPCTINRLTIGGDAPVRVMGVINASPESFYRSSYVPVVHVYEITVAMLEGGADLIDVGARATGPGAPPLDIATERERLVAVLQEIQGVATVSVDTMHPEVLETALKYEIHAVNDIAGLSNPAMGRLVAEAGLPAIVMAAERRPGDTGSVPEVLRVLGAVVARCGEAGVRQFILDPGIGLWTPERTVEDNWDLCRHFRDFLRFDRPILAAISRKSFIGTLVGRSPEGRMAASLALTLLLIQYGASMVRTHDVQETVDALRVVELMEGGQ